MRESIRHPLFCYTVSETICRCYSWSYRFIVRANSVWKLRYKFCMGMRSLFIVYSSNGFEWFPDVMNCSHTTFFNGSRLFVQLKQRRFEIGSLGAFLPQTPLNTDCQIWMPADFPDNVMQTAPSIQIVDNQIGAWLDWGVISQTQLTDNKKSLYSRIIF